MKKVNIFEAKARLSEFVDAVERGERVLICRRNRAVAELRPVAAARTSARPVGGGEELIRIPDSFFAPLPAGIVDAFYDDAPAGRSTRAIVAERPPAYRKSRQKPRKGR